MVVSRKSTEPTRPRRPPATTPASRENQLIAAAIDLAEKQIREGTASSQVITHFLKLATTREKLEQEKLARENVLLGAKVESMQSATRMEALYEDAIKAMRGYQGQDTDDEEYDYED